MHRFIASQINKPDLYRHSFDHPQSQLTETVDKKESSLMLKRRGQALESLVIYKKEEGQRDSVLKRIRTLITRGNTQKIGETKVAPLSKTSFFQKHQKLIYLLLENPRSSLLSSICHLFVIFGIICSVFEAILVKPQALLSPPKLLICVDAIILSIFGIEFLMRIFSATAFNDKLTKKLLKPVIAVDILAMVPLFITVLMDKNGIQSVINDPTIISLFKAISVLKLSRYVKNANVLAKGIKQSLISFAFLTFVIILANVIFATMAYYAERADPRSKFNQGIPMALWWSIVTMTTVGYGDIVPITPLGKCIGGVVGIFGMMVLALPVVILGYHFEEVYNEVEEDEKINKIKDKVLAKMNDLSQNQKEAYFLKRRIGEIEMINKNITQRLEVSVELYKNVSHDLKSLYSAVYSTDDDFEVKSVFGSKSRAIERFAAAKRKISLVQLFKRGFRDGRRPSGVFPHAALFNIKPEDVELNHMSMDMADVVQKMGYLRTGFNNEPRRSRSASQFDDPDPDPENIIFEKSEIISAVANLQSKKSVLAKGRGESEDLSSDLELRKKTSRFKEIPKIIVDDVHRSSIQSSPENISHNLFSSPDVYDLPQENHNPSKRSLHLNTPSIMIKMKDEDLNVNNNNSNNNTSVVQVDDQSSPEKRHNNYFTFTSQKSQFQSYIFSNVDKDEYPRILSPDLWIQKHKEKKADKSEGQFLSKDHRESELPLNGKHIKSCGNIINLSVIK